MAKSNQRAYLLLEMMIGVAVFSIGVLVLAQCLENCLEAEAFRVQDQLARQVLETRMAEVRTGVVSLEDSPREDQLEGRFSGIRLIQRATPLEFQDEEGNSLAGLYRVDLEASWQGSQGEQSHELSFYGYHEE